MSTRAKAKGKKQFFVTKLPVFVNFLPSGPYGRTISWIEYSGSGSGILAEMITKGWCPKP
jgi:hypothetical protein